MTDKIRKFFAKKKEDAKFKLAGPGRKLNATDLGSGNSSGSKSKKDVYVAPTRNELSQEAKFAAAAAMSRNIKKDTREFNSLAAIQAQVKKELEAEKKAKLEEANKQQLVQEQQPQDNDNKIKNYAVSGVFFRCSLISDEILPKKDWRVKIKEFLYDQLEHERGLTACLIIQNCNTKDKAEICVEILSKYLDNIIKHPDEEKYHRIRMSNKIFYEKVRFIEGTLEFLIAAGFREKLIDGEEFLVWSLENIDDIEQLTVLIEGLTQAEPITLDLDRNIQILLSSQARKNELPPEFYRISAAELKKEQELKSNAVENASMLKTKAMREREELKTLNRYRYTLIRVRFPNGIYIQGTFNVYEKLLNIYEFVQSCLCDEQQEFLLSSPTLLKFTVDDMEKTLFDLRLIPNVILNFSYENNVTEGNNEFIKEELLMLIQQI